MSRFPFFKEISGARALVVGGGSVALRRARVLADSGAKVTCIAPRFCEGFDELYAERIRRKIEVADVLDRDIVVVATDDHVLNAAIAVMAKSQGSEVSVADDPSASTFLFPATVRRGGMTIGVSSDGASPAATKYVRQQIEAAIPENFEAVLELMEAARSLTKSIISDPKRRSVILSRIFEECLKAEVQPDAEALEGMIRRFHGTELD